MGKTRRRFDAALKAEVALAALRSEATIAELATKYQLHPKLILTWKKQLQNRAVLAFGDRRRGQKGRAAQIASLYANIGQLTVEELKKRDDFIISKGLWAEFVASICNQLVDRARNFVRCRNG